MQHHLSTIAINGLLFASIPAWAGEQTDIHKPDERATVVLAAVDRAPAVVVSAMTFDYDIPQGSEGLPGESVRKHCATLSEEDRRRTAECVLLEEHTLRLAGRVEERDSLFLEGVWRDGSHEWPSDIGNEPLAIAKYYAEYGDIVFGSISLWADRIYIGYGSTAKQDSARLVMRSGSALWREPRTGRVYMLDYNGWASRPRVVDLIERSAYSLARRGTLQEFDEAAMEIKEFPLTAADQAPAGLAAWRVLPAAPAHERDQSRVLLERIADPSAPEAIGDNDLVLYLREEPLLVGPDAERTPILQLDGVLLDEAGRALQRQLAMALVVSDGGAEFGEQYLDTIHPDSHKKLIESQRRRKESERISGGITEPASPFASPLRASAIPSLRVVSRVNTGECIVWFGWLPDRDTLMTRRFDPETQPISRDTPRQFVTIVQRKAGGEWLLTYPENPGMLGPERLATQLLTSPGVAESLVRARRHIFAVPEPVE